MPTASPRRVILPNQQFQAPGEQLWPTKQGGPYSGCGDLCRSRWQFSALGSARNYWQGGGGRCQAGTGLQLYAGAGVERVGRARWYPLLQWSHPDWVLWQKGQDPVFADLCKVLEALSASDDEQLMPGQPVRLGWTSRITPPAHALWPGWPLVHASAGIRRIAALAYLLVWTWREHQLACEQTGRKQAKDHLSGR